MNYWHIMKELLVYDTSARFGYGKDLDHPKNKNKIYQFHTPKGVPKNNNSDIFNIHTIKKSNWKDLFQSIFSTIYPGEKIDTSLEIALHYALCLYEPWKYRIAGYICCNEEELFRDLIEKLVSFDLCWYFSLHQDDRADWSIIRFQLLNRYFNYSWNINLKDGTLLDLEHIILILDFYQSKGFYLAKTTEEEEKDS